MEKEVQLQVKFKVNLPVQHKYFPELHNSIGVMTEHTPIFQNKNKKQMLAFPNPKNAEESCYISTKYIEVIEVIFNKIPMFTIKNLMKIILSKNLKLPLVVNSYNIFKGKFAVGTILYISDKDDKLIFRNEHGQNSFVPSKLTHTVFFLTKVR